MPIILTKECILAHTDKVEIKHFLRIKNFMTKQTRFEKKVCCKIVNL